MSQAKSMFDGRTKFSRTTTRPAGRLVAHLLLAPPLPKPVFEVGQAVVTPKGKLVVIRRYHENTVVNAGWAYIFRVLPAPVLLSNGVTICGRAVETKYAEKVLLPLQIANVPPVPPAPPNDPPMAVAMPDLEPDDAWAVSLEAWVRDVLGVG